MHACTPSVPPSLSLKRVRTLNRPRPLLHTHAHRCGDAWPRTTASAWATSRSSSPARESRALGRPDAWLGDEEERAQTGRRRRRRSAVKRPRRPKVGARPPEGPAVHVRAERRQNVVRKQRATTTMEGAETGAAAAAAAAGACPSLGVSLMRSPVAAAALRPWAPRAHGARRSKRWRSSKSKRASRFRLDLRAGRDRSPRSSGS